MYDDLLNFLSEHYKVTNSYILRKLQTKGERSALLLKADEGVYVVKISDPNRPEKTVQSDTGILSYLEIYEFAAPRLLLTRYGKGYLPYQSSYLYLYGYIEGEHPTPGIEFMKQVGKQLANLHRIPHSSYNKFSSYYPTQILREVRSFLVQALDTDQRIMAVDLIKQVDSFPSFDSLPRSLIHTDPYIVNWIEDRSGKFFLIDWDDAGIGIPLLDVGYGVAHLSTYPRHEAERWGVPVMGQITWREDWSRTFFDAYNSVRPLSSEELKLFPFSIKLSFLAYIWDWDMQRVIPENYERMQIFNRIVW